MCKFFGHLGMSVLFFIIALVAFAFAQDSTSTDLLQNGIINLFDRMHVPSQLVGILYVALIGVLFRFLQWLLKKVPTKWGPNGPALIWTIAGIFFGKSIVYYNSFVSDKLSKQEKDSALTKLMNDVNSHFDKHNAMKT